MDDFNDVIAAKKFCAWNDICAIVSLLINFNTSTDK